MSSSEWWYQSLDGIMGMFDCFSINAFSLMETCFDKITENMGRTSNFIHKRQKPHQQVPISK